MKTFKKHTRDYSDEYIFGWYKSTKLKSGKTIEIWFTPEEFQSKLLFWVYAVTYHKRKQEKYIFLTTNNKDGVAGLLWLKEQILLFEEEYQSEPETDKDTYIVVSWDDNRRRNVYNRGLSKYGYQFNMIDNEKVLRKKIY